MLPVIVKTLSLFNLGFSTELERSGKISVLSSALFPNYLIKVPVEKIFKTHTNYNTLDGQRQVEANSFELRVPTAWKMRKIIEEKKLSLLYVPQKWDLDQKILVERLDLLSWDDTEKTLNTMPDDEQIEYIRQIFILLCETGNQEIPRNLRLLQDKKTLALFDTEPHGTTLSKIEDIRPLAYLAFLNESFFSHSLKQKGLRNLNSTDI